MKPVDVVVTELPVTNQWCPAGCTDGPPRANQSICQQVTCSIPTQHAKTRYINTVYQRDYYLDSSGIPRQEPGNRNEGYIRTLIHVLSLVLRLQSYIVTCVYLLLTVTLYLIITWQHSRIDQYFGIDLFGALPGTVPRYLKRTQSAVRPIRQQYGWEHRSLTLETRVV